MIVSFEGSSVIREIVSNGWGGHGGGELVHGPVRNSRQQSTDVIFAKDGRTDIPRSTDNIIRVTVLRIEESKRSTARSIRLESPENRPEQVSRFQGA